MYNLTSVRAVGNRDTVRDFVVEVIKPARLKPERLEARARPLLVQALDKGAEMGLRTLALRGLWRRRRRATSLLHRPRGTRRGDPRHRAVLAQTSTLAQALFDRLMTAEQRARFLPPFLAEQRYHLALAEHEAGSRCRAGIIYHRPQASARLSRRPRCRGRCWVVSGSKTGVAAHRWRRAVRRAGKRRRRRHRHLLVAARHPGLERDRDRDGHALASRRCAQ